jgi:hypothetical protein
MKFINRDHELKALADLWRAGTSQLVVVYGKRRVGKTELIKRFIHGKPSIYFLARRIRDEENLFYLGHAIGEFFGDTILKTRGFARWDQVFSFLKERAGKGGAGRTPRNRDAGRLVLVIDEFPYLAEANRGISSIFQAGWDEHLKNTPIFLMLCGSSIGMMEQEALAYKAPLYGRRTGQLFVKPLSFSEAREFFPRFRFEEALRAYSIAGGTPAYLMRLAGYPSLEKAVEEEILSPERFLYEEVEFILMEELREPRNYFSILRAIGSHCTKVSEIVNATGLEKSALHTYLFVLEDLHIVEKQVPVTEKHPQRSRKGRYYLKDQFFTFWFNYCFPFMGELELRNKVPSMKAFRNSFEGIVAKNYETAAQEILRECQEELFVFHRIGRWWDKNEEIDIVALNETTNEILLGEVKWSKKQVGTDVFESLKRKSQKVEWGKRSRKEYYCLFSRSGFTPEMRRVAKKEGVFLFKLDRLSR